MDQILDKYILNADYDYQNDIAQYQIELWDDFS